MAAANATTTTTAAPCEQPATAPDPVKKRKKNKKQDAPCEQQLVSAPDPDKKKKKKKKEAARARSDHPENEEKKTAAGGVMGFYVYCREHKIVDIGKSDHDHVENLQRLIGGFFTILPSGDFGKKIVAYCDDEGAFKKELKRNWVAELLLCDWLGVPIDMSETGVRGPVVIVGSSRSCEDASLPDCALSTLDEMADVLGGTDCPDDGDDGGDEDSPKRAKLAALRDALANEIGAAEPSRKKMRRT